MAKILITEDEIPAIVALQKHLTREGHEVIKAFNGEDAIKKALEIKPDLMIIDILMPTSNGLDLLNDLRKDPWGKTAKVIMLTNLSDDIYIDQAKEYGVTDYLVKADITLQELSNTIRKYM